MPEPFHSQSELFVWLLEFFSSHLGLPADSIRASDDLRRESPFVTDEQWSALFLELRGQLATRGIAAMTFDSRSPVSVTKLTETLFSRERLATNETSVIKPDNRQLMTLDKQNNAEITLWYGTNRKLNDAGDAAQGFSSERDDAVHYGTCKVFVPKSHMIGSVGSTWIRRLLKGADDRLKLTEIRSLQRDPFWSSVREYLASLPGDERHALIFVHGYNVSFEAAALRAAQIGCDLAINGIMAFFSWPSRGSLKGYAADASSIEATEPYLTKFLSDLVERSGATKVHLVAHSMGNRGVLRAVSNLVKAGWSQKYGQIILAAADVDTGTFGNLSAAYVSSALRTTMYVSALDRAVEASRWIYDSPRIGLSPPVCVFSGIDTVSVTNVALSFLGHGYVAESRAVLTDIHDLIIDNADPSKRFGLRRLTNPSGQTYWEIGG
jgi:esterase/lipase superfamily enzyme